MSQPVFQYLSLLNALLCTVRSPWLFQPSKSLAQQLHPHSTFEWGYRVSRRRQWHPTPVLLPGKSHGWRGLEGCSPWSRWGSDTTKWLHFHFSLSCIGEGNGNPPVFLPGEFQGRGSLMGCRLRGRTESDTTDVTQHQQQQWRIKFLCSSWSLSKNEECLKQQLSFGEMK